MIKNTKEDLIQKPKFLEDEGHEDDGEDVAAELQEVTQRTLELMTNLETCVRTLLKEHTMLQNEQTFLGIKPSMAEAFKKNISDVVMDLSNREFVRTERSKVSRSSA